MDIKFLNTFKTIVEEGSFVKAASKLNYTQSAITFHIRQLEEELSTRLFEKLGRRRVLTKAGEQLVPYVDEVLASVGKMQFFQDDIGKCQGNINIGFAETQLCYKMPPVLKMFHEEAPNARIFLRSMSCYDIRDELMGGDLDLGIFYEYVGGFGTNLTTYPLGEYKTILVASPELKKTYPDLKTSDEKIEVPLIAGESDCIFRQIIEKYLREKSIQIDHTIELWSIPTMIKLVASGIGMTFLPEFTVKEELTRGELVEIPTDMTDLRVSAVCAHPKDKWVSPLMKEFIDLCCDLGTDK